MRKITKQAIEAFKAGKNFRLGATHVNQRIGGMELVLHDNIIAKNDNGYLEINLCGWNTPTTRERLNGFGVGLFTKKGQLYMQNILIPSNEWIKIG